MIRREPLSTATTDGSFRTMPSPFTYTRVLAVPRSIAMSLTGTRRPELNQPAKGRTFSPTPEGWAGGTEGAV